MEKFIMKKSSDANIYKSINTRSRVNEQINNIVNEANKGKSKKEYSFNGFVISACEFAIKHM